MGRRRLLCTMFLEELIEGITNSTPLEEGHLSRVIQNDVVESTTCITSSLI